MIHAGAQFMPQNPVVQSAIATGNMAALGFTGGNANISGNLAAVGFVAGVNANSGVTANVVIPAVATLRIESGIVTAVV